MRLKQKPDQLQQYDAVIKDQLRQGVAEPVEETDLSSNHEIH